MPIVVTTAAEPRHGGAMRGWGSGAGQRRPRQPLPGGFSTLKQGTGVQTLPRPTVPPPEPRPPRRRGRAANQPRCWFPAVVYFTDKSRRGRVLHGGSHPGRGTRSHQCPRAGAASAAPTARQRGLGDNRNWGVVPAEKQNLPKLERCWRSGGQGWIWGGSRALTSWGSWRGWRRRRRCSCSAPAARSPCCPTPRPSCTETRSLSRRQSPAW